MFRFERRAAVKHVADMPAAVQFAAEVTAYLNKRHSLNMKVGVELFSTGSIHWYYDLESLDKSVAVERDVAAGPRVHRNGQQEPAAFGSTEASTTPS